VTFPVYFHFFGHSLHAHLVMELLGYTAGSQLYFLLRKRSKLGQRASLPLEANLWIIVGCIFGALAGSKSLALVESWPFYRAEWNASHDPAALFGGKTIVGGLLGGWAGVEIAKKILRVSHSTGDLFVFPLIVGMSLGRVGCFLTGLPDHTYGNFTSLPWGVDFGDGPRHPTQLYEIAFLLLLGIALIFRTRRPFPSGRLFRLFLAGYLLFRFAIEFIKPRYHPYFGLSAIQVSCAAGLACLAATMLGSPRRHGGPIAGDALATQKQPRSEVRREGNTAVYLLPVFPHILAVVARSSANRDKPRSVD
jgi:prolipoprotein diacylglyceryltransferase